MPSEMAIRYAAAGYKIIAVTDHADYSNIEFVVKSTLRFTKHWPAYSPIKVLPGIELTHLPLAQFAPLARFARKQGIKIIIGHGESPVEPVIEGTNRAALESDIDILAHPGEISRQDIKLAKKRNIFLEVTSRAGHCRSNSWVIKHALDVNAPLILNHDSHGPEDIITPKETLDNALKSGLTRSKISKINLRVMRFLHKK